MYKIANPKLYFKEFEMSEEFQNWCVLGGNQGP